MIDLMSPVLSVLGKRPVTVTYDYGDDGKNEKIKSYIIRQLEDGRYQGQVLGSWFPVKLVENSKRGKEKFTMYRKIGKPDIPGFG